MATIKDWFMNNWALLLKIALFIIIGLIIIKIILSVFKTIFKRSKMESTTSSFLSAVIKIILYVIYFIVILSLLGIPTTSFVAILTAFSLALSLALQDTLSNFASGILLIANKPFKAGDFVEVAGVSGTVVTVKISVTVLSTPDNKLITIPNSTVSKSEIINYSAQPNRRVDFVFTASYGSDIDKVKGVIMSVVEKEELVNQDLGVTVRLSEQGDSALKFVTRVWTKNEDYWNVYFNLNEKMVKAFVEAGIEIPFNQIDVHMRRDA